MALLAPRRTLHPPRPSFSRKLGWRAVLAAALAFAAADARAQVTVGGNHPPDVIVDQSVLDQLGPPPTLPQLFGAHGAADSRGEAPHPRLHPVAKSAHPAAKAKKPAKFHKPARHKTRTAAPAHKSPHSGGVAAKGQSKAHPAPRPQTQTTKAAPPETKPAAPAIAIDAPPPPAPMPPPPEPIAVPPPPVLPPVPPHVEAPTPTGKPPEPARADAAPTPLVPMPAAASTAKAAPPVPAKPAAPPAVPVQLASVAGSAHALSAVRFAPGATELPSGKQPVLDALAARLLADQSLRVQLVAHATGGTDEAMEARRISLARAVAVRAYLIGKGVRSLRVDVRALGNRPEQGPVADEVDLVVVTQ